MKNSIIIALLQNTSILLAFAMLYENIWIKDEKNKSLINKIIIGFVLSGIGIVIMYTTWYWVPGIVFDTRSVMISISGLFFGFIPTVILMAVTTIVRLVMGGGGQWMGIAVIITSGTIGLLWRYFRPNWKEKKYKLELLGMGLTVHLVMALCTLLLPPAKILLTLQTIAIPLFFVYTPVTVLLGILMINQYKNSENRYAQMRLIEAEKRFVQILDSGNIVSLILKPNGIIKYCNNYLLLVTGYTKEEVINKNWFHLFVPSEMRVNVYEQFLSNNQNKQLVSNNESCILTKNGKRLFFSWYNTFLASDSTENSGIASIGVNITESKNYEKTLREKNRKIAIQNEEYKLMNRKLQFAKEKAEESERLKSAFLANMSHEIRTPMNGILGFADLLKEPNLSGEEQKEYLNIIEKSGRRMLNIINDIISISRIEAGLMTLKIQPSNINEQLEYIYTFFKPEVENKGLLFSYKTALPDEDANVNTDKEKIYAVLTNLVKNAIKFTDQGFIEFGYVIKESYLEFYVKDSGVGIPKEKQNEIFERFMQAERIDHNVNQGAGLGLSITKAYLEMLGGQIWVESELSKGSTFYFTIPYNSGKDLISAENKKETVKEPVVESNRPLILVAEDDDSSTKYITLVLKKKGFNVLCVNNGTEAVESCKNNPQIKMVFMDIQMPIMDGYEAAKLIREFDTNVPIIAQTAFAFESDKEIVLTHHFDDYIAKPIKPNDLYNILNKYGASI
jgi:PAS domain S-box-containing protein